jgi:hypothetical protein
MRAFTGQRHHWRATLVAGCVVLVALAGVLSVQAPGRSSSPPRVVEETEGLDEREPVSRKPTVEAAFAAESYRAGATAELIYFDSARRVTLRLFRVGDEVGMLRERDVMRGAQVGATHRLASVSRGQIIRLRLDTRWQSGLYYAESSAPGGRCGYAPFVLAPRHLGQHRIAVVLPTQTWQAYNFRDDDGNGTADTWYASADTDTARLIRPFENRGVPPHYHYYDEPFLRWLARNHYGVDFLSDAELRATSGATLARAYTLLIFEGHHEYVTEHEYDAVTGFRNRGGNLMFLSANTFFYKITISEHVMTRIGQWRNLGRPEAALVGAQYFGYDAGARGGAPWVLRTSPAGKWIFRGTGLSPGSPFSSGGIEADHTSSASPRGTQIIAEIPNAFGSGRTAQMTYYETPAGARVFAAGAFSLACSVWQPPVQRVMANLIAALSPPSQAVAPHALGDA